MKVARFMGGFTVGFGLCYVLNQVKLFVNLPARPFRDIDGWLRFQDAENNPDAREIRSLRKQITQKGTETTRLFRKYLNNKTENDPTEDKKEKAVRNIGVVLKRMVDYRDNEIKWLKDRLGKEDQLQEEEP